MNDKDSQSLIRNEQQLSGGSSSKKGDADIVMKDL